METTPSSEITLNLNDPIVKKLKRQLEYYFGDINYPKDKFMRSKAAENKGFIPIAVFITFNRIKADTSDVNLITAILKTIPDLEVLEDQVRRIKPLPDSIDYKARADHTVVFSGFPTTEPIVTIDELTELILPYANPVAIFRKRYFRSKEFKGKVYLQFESVEDAKKLADLKEITWKDHKITIVAHEEYIKEKTAALAAKGIVYKPFKRQLSEKHENTRKNKKQRNDTPAEPAIEIVKGVLLETNNVPVGLSVTDLKAYFARYGNVQFIDNSKERENIVIIRFADAKACSEAYGEISEKKFQIKGNVIDGRLLSEEAEDKYWKESIIPSMEARKARFQNRKREKNSSSKSNKRQKNQSRRKPDQSKPEEPTPEAPEKETNNETPIKEEPKNEANYEIKTPVKEEPKNEANYEIKTPVKEEIKT